MTNAGTEAAHLVIYANAFRSDGPWQYDVSPGAAVTDYFNAGLFGSRKFDLTAYGPNGFQRRFAGDLNTLCNQIEASAEIHPVGGRVTLLLRNLSGSTVTFKAKANAYLNGGPWNYSVSSGSTLPIWFVVRTNNNWYDLTVTTSADASFLRRFAGHIEAAASLGQGTPLLFAAAPGSIHLTWTAGPTLKLQKSTDLNSTNWLDVPNSLGASNVDVTITGAAAFFRLTQ